MIAEAFPPGLVLVLGGFVLPLVEGRTREALALLLPLASLVLIWQVPDGPAVTMPFLSYELVPVKGDALSRLFATIFAIMAFAGNLFALRQARLTELVAASVYAGASIGVAFAGDLVTVFVFWEVMALGSTMVIWAAGTDSAYRSSFRYILIHLLGGVLLMAGIADHVTQTGSIAFTAMQLGSRATWLILAGILVNVAAPPLSAWLPDAYPEASPSGTVFLSAFTTKAAVYALMRGFPGTELLIYIGLYMAFYGIMYALLENDMRRILAYSIVNQVGFMVAGIGLGTEMALNGAAAQAFAHIIYKALLLMSAGSVLYMTGRRKCTDLGGLFQSMPLTCICGIIGALSISFPGTSGFVSKSMIFQAAGDEHLGLVWLLLTAASAGVFLSAGFRFPWFVFFHKDSGLRPPDPPLNMKAAMVIFAFLCIFLGVVPGPLYALLPFPVHYEPYTGSHVIATLQLLLFSGLAFFLLLPLMKRTLTITLDIDWFYRRAGAIVARKTVDGLGAAERGLEQYVRQGLDAWIRRVFHLHGPGGVLARTWQTGSTVLCVTLLFAVVLVFSYL